MASQTEVLRSPYFAVIRLLPEPNATLGLAVGLATLALLHRGSQRRGELL